jgi:hypothetical protein
MGANNDDMMWGIQMARALNDTWKACDLVMEYSF